jgi:GNAT superfamily N-acetyltransferase
LTPVYLADAVRGISATSGDVTIAHCEPLSVTSSFIHGATTIERPSGEPANPSVSFSIRRFADTDYDGISSIHNALTPDLPLSPREMRFADVTRDQRCLLERWIADMGGKTAGFAELTQSSETYHPTRFQFRIFVLPEFEGNGVMEGLFATVLQTFRDHRGVSLKSVVGEDRAALSSFLENSGFIPSMRYIDKTLDLNGLDLRKVRENLQALPNGISVKTLGELRSDPACHRKLFKLEKALRQDAPNIEDTSFRFDFFECSMLGQPGLLQDGYFVAMDGDRYIGTSSLFRREGNLTVCVRLTGVIADYRKRGIATNLKMRSLLYAHEAGFAKVFTCNEENNRPISELNDKLGFRTLSSRTFWTRTF